MSDDELLLALRDTFATLDGWRAALETPIEPEPGSDLAMVDDEWGYLPTTTLISVGLASAREHLHAVRLLVEANELFPVAVSTLCRSALIGASLAVWILEPDERRERLRRSLSLALEDYKRHVQFGQDVKDLLPPDQIHPTADEQLARLAARQRRVRSLLNDLGGLCAINLTDDVIPTALKVAVPNASERAPMILRWRSMSGAAHALTWHFFGNDGTSVSEVNDHGIGQISVEGDIGRLVMDYFPAYHVAAAGWRLLEQRCLAPRR